MKRSQTEDGGAGSRGWSLVGPFIRVDGRRIWFWRVVGENPVLYSNI